MLDEFRDLSREWIAGAEQIMAHGGRGAARGRHRDAERPAGRPRRAPQRGVRRVDPAQRDACGDAGQAPPRAVDDAQRDLFIAIGLPLASAGAPRLADLPPDRPPDPGARDDRQVHRGRRLRQAVPFTKAADETGELARSIDVLKQGAAAMEEQRWVKANTATLTGELQGAAVSRRVRATASFRPRAHARRRRRRLLPVRERPASASGASRAMAWRTAARRRVSAGRGPGRPVRARAQADHPDESSAGLSRKSPRAWARPRRSRPSPGR